MILKNDINFQDDFFPKKKIKRYYRVEKIRKYQKKIVFFIVIYVFFGKLCFMYCVSDYFVLNSSTDCLHCIEQLHTNNFCKNEKIKEEIIK